MFRGIDSKKKIIVFYGYKGSGKDTCHDILKTISGDRVYKFSFAEALRGVCWDLFKTKLKDKNRLWGAIDKKEEPIEGWIIPQVIRETCDFKETLWTGRRLLQWMGTDVCRRVHDEIWTEKLVENILSSDHKFDIGVVTDCRFHNEYKALYELKDEFDVKFIYVDRANIDNDYSGHASERDMKDFEYDIRLENRGTLTDLQENIKVALEI